MVWAIVRQHLLTITIICFFTSGMCYFNPRFLPLDLLWDYLHLNMFITEIRIDNDADRKLSCCSIWSSSSVSLSRSYEWTKGQSNAVSHRIIIDYKSALFAIRFREDKSRLLSHNEFNPHKNNTVKLSNLFIGWLSALEVWERERDSWWIYRRRNNSFFLVFFKHCATMTSFLPFEA